MSRLVVKFSDSTSSIPDNNLALKYAADHVLGILEKLKTVCLSFGSIVLGLDTVGLSGIIVDKSENPCSGDLLEESYVTRPYCDTVSEVYLTIRYVKIL